MSSVTPSKVMSAAMQDLAAVMSELWRTRKNSDLTIVCGSEVSEVHSWVLCSRSGFFAAACHGGFKEATTKRIELPDDNPAMVKRMLLFCYGKNYCDEKLPDDGPLYVSRIHTNAEMYALAHKYELEGLKKFAKHRLTELMGWWITSENFSIHRIQMIPSILTLISLAYNRTPESDRTLRDPLATYTQAKWNVLSNDPNIKIALAEHPDFAFDVINSKPAVMVQPKPELKMLSPGGCFRCSASDKWKCYVLTCDCGQGEDIMPTRVGALP